ncbi:hypothetical protein EJ02DRAFT_248378 [Clathrospora elynae]|uniref:DUF7730 domain-containing protein n=1 Tax=Clathrospora elynae TaxID=706981 RepID=A0A6A5T201_9PLEO|nr:hypothetical protein EJ02DRAFT_248378 [Clathrospora elynae]
MAQADLPSSQITSVQDFISLRNRRESPLVRVPAEIRNKIYGYALGGLEFHIKRSDHEGKWFRAKRLAIATRPIDADRQELPKFDPELLALTATCRQIYIETKLLPLAANEFIGSLNYLKSLVSGCIIDSTRLLFIEKLRIYVTDTEIEDEDGEYQIRRSLTNLLLVLCGMTGLKRVTLEWTGKEFVATSSDFILDLLFQEGERVFGGANQVKVVVVSDQN